MIIRRGLIVIPFYIPIQPIESVKSCISHTTRAVFITERAVSITKKRLMKYQERPKEIIFLVIDTALFGKRPKRDL